MTFVSAMKDKINVNVVRILWLLPNQKCLSLHYLYIWTVPKNNDNMCGFPCKAVLRLNKQLSQTAQLVGRTSTMALLARKHNKEALYWTVKL